MAITQNRVISILAAARRFYNAATETRKQMRALVAGLPQEPTYADLLEIVQAVQFLSIQPLAQEDDIALLAAEERHFQTAYKKNQKLAEYARRRRAGVTGLSFTGHKAKGAIDPKLDITDEAKELHYANAERVIGLAQTDQAREIWGKSRTTAPDRLHKPRPIDLSTTNRPQRAVTPLSDAALGLSPLAVAKFEANKLKLQFNMKPDYEDPTDDSQPLTPDDARAFGFSPPADDGELF